MISNILNMHHINIKMVKWTTCPSEIYVNQKILILRNRFVYPSEQNILQSLR